MIEISVIIVVRNEQDFIVNCIQSIEEQFICRQGWELIVVDGISDDNTLKLVDSYLSTVAYSYKILNNNKKILSSGWNIGLKAASGKYVIRPDAHATLESNYIKFGIITLEEMSNISAVGGILETVAEGFWGSIIKEALSSRIGVGNSSFRTTQVSGYYDTAVFAVYRKEVFNAVGYFNEDLIRHQDNEMHHRILLSGGKFYLNNKMKAKYYCRDSVPKLAQQMFNIGKYLPSVVKSGSLSARHFAPFSFYSLVVFFSVLGLKYSSLFLIPKILLFFYFLTILIDILITVYKKRKISLMLNMFIIPIMHFSYAIGTLSGLCLYLFKKNK